MNKNIQVEFDGFICRITGLPVNVSGPLERYLSLAIDESIYLSMSTKTAIPLSYKHTSGSTHAVITLGDRVFFLTGLLPSVIKFLKRYNYTATYTSRVPLSTPASTELSDMLYPHQRKIIEACLQHKRGVIKSPTGSGKTVCIGELSRLFSNSKMLITVPTIALLYQMKSDILKFYNLVGVDPPSIGLVGDGNYNFSTRLTVCIPNTAVSKIEGKDQDFIKYLASVDILAADECHTTATASYGTLAGKLSNRRWSFGFSGTPWSNTGANLIIEGLFGQKIVEVHETDMIEQGVILKPSIKFYKAPIGTAPKDLLAREYSHYVYNKLYDFLIVNNRRRNQLIVDLAVEFIAKQEGPLIILVNKVGTVINKQTGKPGISHSKLLQDLLRTKGIDLEVLHGGTPKKERESIFSHLREFSIPGIIAGPKVMTMGIDIHSIACVILAGAGKSDKDMIQRVGRALRLPKGSNKKQPLIIDMFDGISYFEKQSYDRFDTMELIYPGCSQIV